MIKKLYAFIMSEKRVAFFRRVDAFLRKIGGKYYTGTLGQLKYRLRFGQKRNLYAAEGRYVAEKELWPKAQLPEKLPLVSVILSSKAFLDEAFFKAQTYENLEYIYPEAGESLEQLLQRAKGEYFLLWDPFLGTSNKIPNGNKIPINALLAGFRFRSVMLSVMTVEESEKEVLSEREFTETGKAKDVPVGYVMFRRAKSYSPEYTVCVDNFLQTDNFCEKLTDWLWKRVIRGGSVACCATLEKKENMVFLKPEAEETKALRVAMVCYSMRSGGGETFPIYLANELYRQGIIVSLINYELEEREDAIVALAEPGMPIYHLAHTGYGARLFESLSADIIHTHQATVDYAVARIVKEEQLKSKHVITLHGMYEVIDPEDCSRTISATMESCSRYIYIADKNLNCFKDRGIRDFSKFQKLPNGLPEISVTPVDRKSLGIGEEDFVMVLASRGIEEKGWKEAMDAMKAAGERFERKLHLVLLGDGPCREPLEALGYPNVHFTGTVTNVRDYFAMGDVGLLPSRYKGESFPLVLIECFLSGRPVIATDVGEVKAMMGEGSKRAGILISTKELTFSVEDLAEAMVRMATDRDAYEGYKENAKDRASLFVIEKVAGEYVKAYRELLS